MKFSPKTIILLAIGALVGIVLLILGPLPAESANAGLRILATVLSIFSGFIMAVITMTGNQDNLYKGNWRLAYAHSIVLKKWLTQFKYLLRAFIVCILLVVLSIVLRGCFSVGITNWIGHFALCLGVTALIWALGVPDIIYRIQIDRLSEEIDTKKTESKLNTKNEGH